MDSLHGIEFYSGILLPGMVNAHTHLELSYLRGKIPEGTGLGGFVSAIPACREATPEPERRGPADVQDALMRAEGIVAAGDICNGDATFDLKKKSGIRYRNFIELFGTDPSVANTALRNGKALADEGRNEGLECSLTPHSTYSVSENLWKGIFTTRQDTASRTEKPLPPLSVHFMESPEETGIYRGTGRLAENNRKAGLHPDFLRYGSPTGRLTATLPAETPLLLIHNTFITEEDIDRLNDRFREITYVLCPRSNAYIEHAVPPVELLRRKGCRIALGTDSLASNTSLSVLEELKYLTARFPDIPLTELAGWATLKGAEALRADGWSSTFEPGKKPGAVLVEGIDWEHVRLTPESASRLIVPPGR